jgi:hypothetical protein
MELPEGFEIDPVQSRQYGTTVAVNPVTGKRIRWSGTTAGKPDKVYAETRARERAKDDADMLEQARMMERDAYGLEATAKRAEQILPKTPTGPLANFRIEAGRALQAVPFAGVLPLVPSADETANLEELRRLGSLGALGDVSKLKGPLSEKELAFIEQMQLDPNATKRNNARTAEYMKWVARRQAAYGRAMRAWEARLGSPTAMNANGLSFDAWWGRYASEKLPAPGVKPAAPAANGGGVKSMSDDDLRKALGL